MMSVALTHMLMQILLQWRSQVMLVSFARHTCMSHMCACCLVVVGGVLLSGSFYMCPTVECILCSENVYTAHCMKQ